MPKSRGRAAKRAKTTTAAAAKAAPLVASASTVVPAQPAGNVSQVSIGFLSFSLCLFILSLFFKTHRSIKFTTHQNFLLFLSFFLSFTTIYLLFTRFFFFPHPSKNNQKNTHTGAQYSLGTSQKRNNSTHRRSCFRHHLTKPSPSGPHPHSPPSSLRTHLFSAQSQPPAAIGCTHRTHCTRLSREPPHRVNCS